MQLSEFETAVERINECFALECAAFLYDNSINQYSVDLFAGEETGIPAEDWERTREIAVHIPLLMVFAFGDAPGEAVLNFGQHHGDGLGEAALERTSIIAAKAPDARAEWSRRQTGLGRSLGDIKVSVLFDPEKADFVAVLRASSFETSGPRRGPIGSSRQYLDAVLTRSDLRRLSYDFSLAANRMPDIDLDESDQAGVAIEEDGTTTQHGVST